MVSLPYGKGNNNKKKGNNDKRCKTNPTSLEKFRNMIGRTIYQTNE